jgi:acyl transferase domain-containing protein
VAPFAAAVRKTRRSPPSLPVVSNLTGTWMTPEEATDPQYWASHLRRPVLFAQGCATLFADARRVFLEVGPGRTLQALVRQGAKGVERLAVGTLPSLGEAEPDRAVFLKGLGQLWASGVSVDWSRFDGEGRRRVPLPTYPFERQPYWHEPTRESPKNAPSMGGSDPGEWLYLPTWRRSIPLEGLDWEQEAVAPGSWLLFRDALGVGDELSRKLVERGFEVVTVTAGDRYEKVAEHSFTIRPRQREDYAALWADLVRSGTVPQGIAHTWTLRPADPDDEAFAPEAEAQTLGFFSLLFLAQAIGEAGPPPALRLEVVATGLFRVTDQETLFPSRTTVLGPCRVIPQEYSGVTCRVHDVALESGASERDGLAESLAAELSSEPQNGVVAHRHGHRWLPAFDRLPPRRGSHRALAVKAEGAYLVTGGLEDPGLSVAEYLAARGARGLVLVCPPDGPSIGGYGPPGDSTEGASEPVAERLAALEAQGVRLAVESVDVADLPAMEAVVARAEGRFGSIRGAVHAARAPSEGLMQFKTARTAARVLATKAGGAWVLQRVLAARSPDFLVLFGSSTGITGIVGQADDCGANAFLDSFACARAARGGAGTLVLDWPPWRQEPDPKRPPPTSPLPALVREIEEGIGITPAEGAAVLDRVLGTSLPQIVISRHDFGALVESQSRFTASNLLEQLRARGGKGPRRSRPARAGQYVPPSTETEAVLAGVWEEVFGFEPIGSSDDFFELGGHSLLAIDMISRVREALGGEIPLGLVFESSRLASLARMVEGAVPEVEDPERFEELLREVEALSPEEAARLLRDEADGSVDPHSSGRDGL